MSIIVKDANAVDRYFGTIGVGDITTPFLSIPADFNLEVAKGNVPGHSSINKFGHNPAATTGEDVWGGGGTYAFYPTTAQTVQAVSSSAADTNTTGTGAWTMEVYGLDSNWDEQNETVTLNGTTPVVLANTYIRLFRTIVLTAGTGEINAGNITVAVSGGDTGIYISAGDGQTQHAIYTVPADKSAYFIQGYVGMADDDKNGEVAEFQWLMRPNNGVTGAWAVKGQVACNSLGSGTWQYKYGVPGGPIPAKSDIRIKVSAATSTLGVVGGYDLILVDD